MKGLVLLALCAAVEARAQPPSVRDVQAVYDEAFHDQTARKKGLLSADTNLDKDAIARGLLGKLQGTGAVQHAAAYAFDFALLPWQPIRWTPGFAFMKTLQEAILPRLDAARTADVGTRHYLSELAGAVAARLTAAAASGSGKSAVAEELAQRTKAALLRVVGSDPEPYVVEPAARYLEPLAREEAAVALRSNKSLAVSGRFLAPPSRSAYQPLASDGADSLEGMHAAAELALSSLESAAGKLARQSRDLARNYRRDPNGPQVSSSESPWGCGSDLQSLVRGKGVEYGNTGDCGGPAGPAMPGGGRAGRSGGWQQITLDLRARSPLERITLQFNGAPYVPAVFKLWVRTWYDLKASSAQRARWVAVFVTSHNTACSGPGEGAECVLTVDFPRLIGDAVRLEFDGGSAKEHVWLNRFQVMSGQPGIAAADASAAR